MWGWTEASWTESWKFAFMIIRWERKDTKQAGFTPDDVLYPERSENKTDAG